MYNEQGRTETTKDFCLHRHCSDDLEEDERG